MITSSTSPSSFFYDQSIDSTKDHYPEPPFILNFQSSFDSNESPLCQIFSINEHMAKDHQESRNKNGSCGKKKGSELEMHGVTKTPRRNNVGGPRKRTEKKDRHSKICTAQGVRDRRIRLSLPIARKFFDLQDMLGFEKASNTIEWLFSNSRKAIKKLHTNQYLSPTQHICLSSDDDDDKDEENIIETLNPGDPNNEDRKKIITNEKKGRSKTRKVMNNYHNAKESREKARARARERTREKMEVHQSKLCYESNPTNKNLDQQISSINFYDSPNGAFLEGHGGPLDHLHANFGSFDDYVNLMQMDSHQMLNLEINDEMVVPHDIDCSYNNNGFMGILGNVDTNGVKMNSCSIDATNTVSASGNNPTSIWCLPSKKFPFSLQY